MITNINQFKKKLIMENTVYKTFGVKKDKDKNIIILYTIKGFSNMQYGDKFFTYYLDTKDSTVYDENLFHFLNNDKIKDIIINSVQNGELLEGETYDFDSLKYDSLIVHVKR